MPAGEMVPRPGRLPRGLQHGVGALSGGRSWRALSSPPDKGLFVPARVGLAPRGREQPLLPAARVGGLGMGAGWFGDGCWAVQGWVLGRQRYGGRAGQGRASGWRGDGVGELGQASGTGLGEGVPWWEGHGQSQLPLGHVSGAGERAGQRRVPERGRAEQCWWVPAELQARHGLRLFSLERSCCYGALLLDEERGRLFAGAQNHLLSLALDDISQRDRKVTGGHAGWAAPGAPRGCERPPLPSQIYWPAPVEWREECNWAGKDITVSARGCRGGARGYQGGPLQHRLPVPSTPRLSA